MTQFTTAFEYNYTNAGSHVHIILINRGKILVIDDYYLIFPDNYQEENEPHHTTAMRALKSSTNIYFEFFWSFIATIYDKENVIYIFDVSGSTLNINNNCKYINAKDLENNDGPDIIDRDLYSIIAPVWKYVLAAI